MNRVAAGAHLPTPWLFEPAKHPDDRADYCLYFTFVYWCKHQVLVFSGVVLGAPYRQWLGLGHRAFPANWAI